MSAVSLSPSVPKHAGPRIHPTAHLEEGVVIGPDSSVWDNVHIRHGAVLGHHVSVGEKSYIAYDVRIGNFVKINAMVYICAGVIVEEMCMISAGVVFTNDRFPRAMDRSYHHLETSDPTEDTLETRVCKGTTIGAHATIGPGLTLGAFSMVGMGSVVTRDVPAHALVIGNPARLVGYVCVCGPRLMSCDSMPSGIAMFTCPRCGRDYRWLGDHLELCSPLVQFNDRSFMP